MKKHYDLALLSLQYINYSQNDQIREFTGSIHFKEKLFLFLVAFCVQLC